MAENNIFVICGTDDFSVKHRTGQIVRGLLDRCGGDALENIEGDGKLDDVLNNFINSVQTPPFLTSQKIVFLRNFSNFDNFLSSSSALAKNALELIFAGMPENIFLVLSAPGVSIDLRKSAAKKIKSAVNLEVFESAKVSDKNYQLDRQNLIREKVDAAGKSISSDALRYLSEALSSDSGVLNNELEKLITYLDKDTKITLELCETLCAKTPDAISYIFTGALTERNLKSSMKMLSELIDNGEVEMRLMAAIGSEFQKLAQTNAAMRDLGLQNVNPGSFDRISAEVKANNPDNFLLKLHPYRAFKICETAARWTPESIGYALKCAAEANLAIVSGGMEPRMAIEQLIFKICSNSNR